MAEEENHALDWFGWVFIILFLYGVLVRVAPYFGSILERIQNGTAPDFLITIHSVITFILDSMLVISIAGIVFVLLKMAGLRRKKLEAILKIETTPKDQADLRWERILKLVSSNNSSDWKVAIIEADAILEEMIRTMGYSGDSLGEKLKSIEKSDFTTLDDAWEAHKFRNRIAHSGEKITQRETKRIITLYEKVFREFEYI